MILSVGIPSVDKPIEKWTNRDFLVHFSNKLMEATGAQLDIPGPAWGAFSGRIKGFRNKLKLSNEKYKEFIDTVFSDFFKQDGYVPAFGAIVSEKVFHVVSSQLRGSSQRRGVPDKAPDFRKLRDELYSSPLFARIQEP